MKIAISGSSGLVGTELCQLFKADGHQVIRLVRSRSTDSDSVYWNWETGEIDSGGLEGIDAVVHLAGENIAARRWSNTQKDLLLRSRVEGTGLIGRALQQLQNPPKVFISASAVGYYGNRGAEPLTEQSGPGRGFLTEICSAWESAAQATCPPQTRLVIARIGVVIGKNGGAVGKMLLPFKLGLGGRIGSGRQYVSWISLADTCRAIMFCVQEQSIDGPVNIVGPNPVTNRDFTQALAAAVSRPCIFPLPSVVVRTIFGEMGGEILLGGCMVSPSVLLASGFKFKHETIDEAFRAIL